jgi:hypothetical protein
MNNTAPSTMNKMAQSPRDELHDFLSLQKTWKYPAIHILDKSNVLVNTTEYIGSNCPDILRGHRHFISQQFADVNIKTREALICTIHNSCADAGFDIIVHSWDEKAQYIQFKCQRYQVS